MASAIIFETIATVITFLKAYVTTGTSRNPQYTAAPNTQLRMPPYLKRPMPHKSNWKHLMAAEGAAEIPEVIMHGRMGTRTCSKSPNATLYAGGAATAQQEFRDRNKKNTSVWMC